MQQSHECPEAHNHKRYTMKTLNSRQIIKTSTIEPTLVNSRFPIPEILKNRYSDKYLLLNELGSGGYGCVYSGVNKFTMAAVACKVVSKSKISNWVTDDCNKQIPLEVYMLQKRLIDYYDEEKYVYIITELHGTVWDSKRATKKLLDPIQSDPLVSKFDKITPMDLFECIERYHHLSETHSKLIFKQIVSAISYMHAIGIVHRDIKDENILIDDRLNVKLIDFGSAASFGTTCKQFERFTGTTQYASPEILRGEKYRGPEADIWALGCCLYVMLTGEVPFSTPKQAISGQYNLMFLQDISRPCTNLISIMLQKDSSKRARITEILSHPWFI